MEENVQSVPQAPVSEDNSYVMPAPPDNSGKNKLIIAGLSFFVVVLLAGTAFLFLSSSTPQQGKKIATNQIQASPTPTPAAASDVVATTEYKNPFDSKTQYTNPFDENKNPFDTLSQLVEQ